MAEEGVLPLPLCVTFVVADVEVCQTSDTCEIKVKYDNGRDKSVVRKPTRYNLSSMQNAYTVQHTYTERKSHTISEVLLFAHR